MVLADNNGIMKNHGIAVGSAFSRRNWKPSMMLDSQEMQCKNQMIVPSDRLGFLVQPITAWAQKVLCCVPCIQSTSFAILYPTIDRFTKHA